MNRIRALREDRDLRQIDVAAATDIDQKTLSTCSVPTIDIEPVL